MPISPELHSQVEAAFDYRGHVTLHFKNGKKLEGFVFNRQFENPKFAESNFIDVFPKNSDEKRRISLDELTRIEISGKNHAETYGQFHKRTGGKT